MMKVVVGVSGGVDSAIATHILKEKGYEVIGVNFQFLDCNKDNVEDVEKISKQLDIPIIRKNYTKEFHKKVIKYFIDEYKNGRTPNPCAFCNGNMKFEKLLEVMREMGADKIATGHYANVGVVDYKNDERKVEKRYYIKKSKNYNKDQSYMLYSLTQEQLSHLILPIADMEKSDVRIIASKIDLDVANKKDSQDICFISEDIDYKEFIKCYDFGYDYREKIARGLLTEGEIQNKSYLKKGEFVDLNGKVLGYHNGIINYTIGQRKGLNIAFGERKFVIDIDAKNSKVVLGNNEDLFSDEFNIKNVNYQLLSKEELKKICDANYKNYENNGNYWNYENYENYGKKMLTKVRYRHDGTECIVKYENEEIINCKLKNNVRAITKGQVAVFYDENDCILFGGIII